MGEKWQDEKQRNEGERLKLAVLRSRIIFMRLRVKNFDAALAPAAPAPAPTLLYFRKELKFKHMLKLSCSFDSLRFMLLKI
jgi:hypothetical protein